MVAKVDGIVSERDSLFSMDALNDFQFESGDAASFKGRLTVTGIGGGAGPASSINHGPSLYNVNFDKTGLGAHNAYIDGIKQVGDSAYTTSLGASQTLKLMTSRSRTASSINSRNRSTQPASSVAMV